MINNTSSYQVEVVRYIVLLTTFNSQGMQEREVCVLKFLSLRFGLTSCVSWRRYKSGHAFAATWSY